MSRSFADGVSPFDDTPISTSVIPASRSSSMRPLPLSHELSLESGDVFEQRPAGLESQPAEQCDGLVQCLVHRVT
jgi:hypothetical protein